MIRRFFAFFILLDSCIHTQFLPQPQADIPDAVQVRLFADQTLHALRLDAPETGFYWSVSPHTEVHFLPPHEALSLVQDSTGFWAKAPHQPPTSIQTQIRIFPIQNGKVRMRTKTFSGQYRGITTFSVVGDQILAAHVVGETDYLASVTASEMPKDELEALKAQAILARTFLMRAEKPVRDDVMDQVYRGVSAERPMAKEAVLATQHQILTYHQKPIEALYSASNGGYSASNASIWNADPLPYLPAQPDAFDEQNGLANWTSSAPKSLVLQALSREADSEITSLTWAGKTKDGRWKQALLDGKAFNANRIRMLISPFFMGGLRSTRFEMRLNGDWFVVKGQGAGHGVGLSQMGALQRARSGQTYQQILAFYFPNTEIAAASIRP